MISLNGGRTNGNVETLIFNAKFLELDLTYYSRKKRNKTQFTFLLSRHGYKARAPHKEKDGERGKTHKFENLIIQITFKRFCPSPPVLNILRKIQ